MTLTAISLDKKSYPLMMHLSILPKYDMPMEEPIYDPETQSIKIDSMSGSWCSRSRSTGNMVTVKDDDTQEDD
jgi:hypothetical protein